MAQCTRARTSRGCVPGTSRERPREQHFLNNGGSRAICNEMKKKKITTWSRQRKTPKEDGGKEKKKCLVEVLEKKTKKKERRSHTTCVLENKNQKKNSKMFEWITVCAHAYSPSLRRVHACVRALSFRRRSSGHTANTGASTSCPSSLRRCGVPRCRGALLPGSSLTVCHGWWEGGEEVGMHE